MYNFNESPKEFAFRTGLTYGILNYRNPVIVTNQTNKHGQLVYTPVWFFSSDPPSLHHRYLLYNRVCIKSHDLKRIPAANIGVKGKKKRKERDGVHFPYIRQNKRIQCSTRRMQEKKSCRLIVRSSDKANTYWWYTLQFFYFFTVLLSLWNDWPVWCNEESWLNYKPSLYKISVIYSLHFFHPV